VVEPLDHAIRSQPNWPTINGLNGRPTFNGLNQRPTINSLSLGTNLNQHSSE
jgi:hypothetical protein